MYAQRYKIREQGKSQKSPRRQRGVFRSRHLRQQKLKPDACRLKPGSDERANMKRSKSAVPAHDILGYERQQLDAIFRPEAVDVIGATDRPGSVERTIMWNLVS